MDPTAAMNMFQNMSPEQRQNMQSMFSNMDPAMIANMQRSMGGGGGPQMDEAQIRQAQEQMKSGQVNLEAGLTQAQKTFKYLEDGVANMKAAGNKLWQAKKYQEASEQYEQAIKQMKEVLTPTELGKKNLKASRLNATLCYLAMESKIDTAIEHCTNVLSTHPTDSKAFYRRGLCYEKQGQLEESLADLKSSVQHSQLKEDVVAEAVSRLEKAVAGKQEIEAEPAWETAPRKSALDAAADTTAKAEKAEKAAAKEIPAAAPNETAKAKQASKEATKAAPKEVAKPKPTAKAKPAEPKAESSSSASASEPSSGKSAVKVGFDKTSINKSSSKPAVTLPNGMPIPQMTADQMAKAANMMQSMPADQMESMMKQSAAMMGKPMPTMDSNQLKMASDMMKNMSPEQMNDMMKAAAPMMGAMNGQGQGGAATAATGGGTPATTATATPPAMAGMPGMPPGMDPNAMAKMAESMQKNPDMMKNMSEMMKGMDPSMMSDLMSGKQPDQTKMAAMAENMAKNPEMMKNMTSMMKDIDPEVLSKQASQMGMDVSPEQAKMMTDKMKDVSPEQMAMMMKWGGRLKYLWDCMVQLYAICFGNMMRASATIGMLVVFFSWLFGIF